jgi:hypothetical protein
MIMIFMKTNKKADITFEKLLKTVIAVALIALIAYFLITRFTSFGDFFKQFNKPQIAQDNSYFSADGVGFMDNGKVLDMSKDELPGGCRSPGPSKLICYIDTDLSTYVIIHNTGFKTRDFFARPIMGYGCNNNNECDISEPIEGAPPCSVIFDKRENCPVNNKYKLSKTGTYRLYPGAKCLAQDCYDPTAAPSSQSISSGSGDILYQNMNSYIEIQVERN